MPTNIQVLSTCSFTRSPFLAFIKLLNTISNIHYANQNSNWQCHKPLSGAASKMWATCHCPNPIQPPADPTHSLRKFLSAMLPYSLKRGLSNTMEICGLRYCQHQQQTLLQSSLLGKSICQKLPLKLHTWRRFVHSDVSSLSLFQLVVPKLLKNLCGFSNCCSWQLRDTLQY